MVTCWKCEVGCNYKGGVSVPYNNDDGDVFTQFAFAVAHRIPGSNSTAYL